MYDGKVTKYAGAKGFMMAVDEAAALEKLYGRCALSEDQSACFQCWRDRILHGWILVA
jgi:hypothetical protein